MVVQKTIGNLKERPKDEKQVVAISSAGAVVLILIVVWAFYFLKSLRAQQVESGAAYELPVDTGSIPVTQTYHSYNTNVQNDQFGLPAQQ